MAADGDPPATPIDAPHDAPHDGPVGAPRDTTDLRAGAPLHDRLLALLPLVGVWAGDGEGVVAARGERFRYRQHVRFAHDGRPFLAYDAQAWLVEDTGALIRPAWRESGFWRPGVGDDDVEIALASNTGQSLVLAGAAGDARWELATTHAEQTPTAVPVDGERRLYAVVGDALLYATELAPGGQPYAPHLNARLERVRDSR